MGDKQDYFTIASSWADDLGAALQASNNRYKLAVLSMTVIVVLLLVCITLLIPIQHLEPVLINHYVDGSISVTKLSNKYKPQSVAEVEGDIVNYIINRESYDFGSYQRQFNLVTTMSNNKVAHEFETEKNILGRKQYRTVHIDNVVFLDKEQLNSKHNMRHRNLAQVDFAITTHNYDNDVSNTVPCRVIISWQYVPHANNSAINWDNWAGFIVTFYQKSNLHVGA